MKNLKRSIVAMLLVIIFVASSIVPVSASTQPSRYSKDYNSGERGVVCTTLDGTSASSYYTGSYTYDRLEDLSSGSLLTTLRGLMTSTHTYKSSYSNCRDYADKTDCENGNKRVTLLYTSYSATMGQYNGWNREHVWPKSLGGNSTTGGGADLHHIRPSDAGVNSSRGNKKYGEAGSNANSKYGSDPATGYLGGYYNSTYFEPLDEVKGDVARICLYVYVRWGSDWGATSITKVFQSVDVLLEWCELDPVDTWEMGRNEVVEDIQGNRNVFIDYPELAWLLFDRDIPDDMTTPSGEAKDGASGSDTPSGGGSGSDTPSGGGSGSDTPSGGGSGTETPSCKHEDTEVKGAVSETCSTDGYTGDSYCKDCGEKLTEGSVIPANNEHDWSEMVVITPPSENVTGIGECVCLACGKKKTIYLYVTEDWGWCYDTEAEIIVAMLAKHAFSSLVYDIINR